MNMNLNCNFTEFFCRWFAPNLHRAQSRYIPWSGLMPWNVHSVTLKMTRGQIAGNKFLDENTSLSRVQSYSPTLRAAQGGKHACGGVQLCAETLLDMGKNIVENCDGGYLKGDVAFKNLDRFIKLAGDHIKLISEGSGTVCRLELTFKGKEEALDDDFCESSLATLLKTFHGSLKAYDGKVITDLGRIVLSAMKGLGEALLLSRSCNFLPFVPDYNEFGEVWACLKHMAINFFSGRNLFFRHTTYSPKLCYLYSRCLLKSSWKGINSTIEKLCSGKENFSNLKKKWYELGGIGEDTYNYVILKNARFLYELDSGILTDTSFEAFNRLYMANCNRQKKSACRAVVCSRCLLMSSEAESALPMWLTHPCVKNDDINYVQSKTMFIDTVEYQEYLFNSVLALSLSQKEAYHSILDSTKNFFLTGVAGSGKSHTLNCLYPRLVFYHGYQCVQLVATTNRAAANINGVTIHRLLGLGVDDDSVGMINLRGNQSLERIQKHIEKISDSPVLEKLILLKCLIIDEAGMLSEDLHYFLSALLQEIKKNKSPFGGVRLILVGDVLQLPPMEIKKKYDRLNLKSSAKNFFFADILNFNSKSYSVAYLRENHRQKNTKFLTVLNMVRIGDENAVSLLQSMLFSGVNVSRMTLSLALKHSNRIFNDINHKSIKEGLMRRISYKYLLEERILSKYWETSLSTRISDAKDTKYSDLIVCCEKTESAIYTTLRCEEVQQSDRIVCLSIDKYVSTDDSYTQPLNNADDFNDLDSKLVKKLEIILGMQYKITCHTGNKYFCANTLVTVDKIVMDGSSLLEVEVSAEESSSTQKSTLKRITINESTKNGKVMISRCQFPLISAIGLLPWSLQCMTITKNIFIDNSRMGGLGSSSQKGFLYTILSRVEDESQICFLHPITAHEVKHGVNMDALKFDICIFRF